MSREERGGKEGVKSGKRKKKTKRKKKVTKEVKAKKRLACSFVLVLHSCIHTSTLFVLFFSIYPLSVLWQIAPNPTNPPTHQPTHPPTSCNFNFLCLRKITAACGCSTTTRKRRSGWREGKNMGNRSNNNYYSSRITLLPPHLMIPPSFIRCQSSMKLAKISLHSALPCLVDSAFLF